MLNDRKYAYWWMVALLLLPLLYVNTGDSHDWGGDFAMYLQQAHNLVNGIPQTQTFYLYNPSCPMLGPQVYPAGFPLLLSPVYAIWGADIQVMTIYLSVLLIFLGILLYILYEKHFGNPAAIILMLVVVYNPWLINFKREIMADIPFTLFFVGAAWLYAEKKATWQAGLVAGIAVMIKSIGWVLMVAFLIDLGGNILKWLQSKPRLKLFPIVRKPVISIIVALIISIGVNNLILGIPAGMGLYSGNFRMEDFWDNLILNLSYYFEIIQAYFYTDTAFLNLLSVLIGHLILILMLAGLIRQIIKQAGYYEWVFLVFVAVLLIYPNRSGGMRFLFPLFPLIVYYAAQGAGLIPVSGKIRQTVVIIAGLLVLSLFVEKNVRIIRKQGRLLDGPQEPVSGEAFAFIRNHTEPNDVIVFIKPRVLGFYAERKCLSNHIYDDVEKIKSDFEKFNADYLLTNVNLPNVVLDEFIATYQPEIVWSNSKFTLYAYPSQ